MPITVKFKKYISVGFLLTLASCAFFSPPEPPRLTLKPAAFSDLSGWADDTREKAVIAFRHSCDRWMNLPPAQKAGPDDRFGTAADWQTICLNLASASRKYFSARTFFETYFQPFQVSNQGFSQGLFTGYYEPVLQGSRVRKPPYTTPLFTQPKDLIAVDLGEFRPDLQGQRIMGRVVKGRLKPYEDRAAIEGSVFRRAKPLVWVKDPVEAFFLQIQGSGAVRLQDGKMLHLAYASQNGHPYTAIGRILADNEEIPRDQVSLPAIKTWLQNHPDQAQALMQQNKSYIFFRVRSRDEHEPLGAEGVPLTPGRSLAVDHKFIPYGLPVWLETQDPLQPSVPFQRLMVAQDTGGAIRGPVRGDVFWGQGEEAARRAGVMKSRGRYWLFLPKSIKVVNP